MAAGRRRATYDDLLRVPDTFVAEIIDGELIATPRPASPHARAVMGMSHALAPFDRVPGGKGVPGGWWILFEPELHLGEDVLVSDLAGWRHERMPEVPDVAAFELAPDWVCEVVSLRTAAVDRARKLPIYARERVAYVWLVDPLARTLEMLRLKDGGWVLTGVHVGPQAVRAEPFETVELDMSAWWLRATAGAHAG